MQYCMELLIAINSPMQFCGNPSLANNGIMHSCKRALFVNNSLLQNYSELLFAIIASGIILCAKKDLQMPCGRIASPALWM